MKDKCPCTVCLDESGSITQVPVETLVLHAKGVVKMKIKFGFDKPSEVQTLWSWVWMEWNFVNCDYKREIGVRFFGITEVHLHDIGDDSTII